MKSSSALPLLLSALAGTSTAFTAQPVRHARSTGRSLRLCASQERQRDEHLDGPHQDINISDVLGRERYMRAVECSKTDGLCDATELEELNSEFQHVFDNDIPYNQEMEWHIAQCVPDMYSDLKDRMKELNIKVNKITSDYHQMYTDEWDSYLGGMYGSSGLAS